MSENVTATVLKKAKSFLGNMTRDERRFARGIRRDAADAMDMGRIEFMRAVVAGDEDAIDELKLAIVDADDSLMFDIERFQEIFTMILEFFRAFMLIFGGL